MRAAFAGAAPALRAVTAPLPVGLSVDPLALAGERGCVFARPGRTVTGHGVAMVLELPGGLAGAGAVAGMTARLGAIEHEDRVGRPGAGVLAFGALPFERAEPSRLVVPRLTVGREPDGFEWVTVVGPDPAAAGAELRRLLADAVSGAPATRPEGPLRLVERQPPGAYPQAVSAAVAAIADGPLRKVVLARFLDAVLAGPIGVEAVLRRLLDAEPSCTAFSVPLAAGQFVGASPELLVTRRRTSVVSHPLAGTVGLSGVPGDDPAATARLVASGKDQREHRFVVEEIARQLRPLCERLDVPGAPTLVTLGSVAHLGTRISGTLRQGDGSLPSALDLVGALHPTPAVGGVPRADALRLIDRLEGRRRHQWAGPVGWIDAEGDGEWVIGIRSATVDGRRARLCAGAGIVTGSDPEAELYETSVKLAPVLDALAPGAGALLRG